MCARFGPKLLVAAEIPSRDVAKFAYYMLRRALIISRDGVLLSQLNPKASSNEGLVKMPHQAHLNYFG